jgi:hypothetical protein
MEAAAEKVENTVHVDEEWKRRCRVERDSPSKWRRQFPSLAKEAPQDKHELRKTIKKMEKQIAQDPVSPLMSTSRAEFSGRETLEIFGTMDFNRKKAFP